MKKITHGFTHGGTFHADDLFSAALLQMLFPGIKISRGFTVPKNFDGIVFDIGGGEFDHHTAPRETRPNGVPYAALGKLWRKYASCFLGEKEANNFDTMFVQPLDEHDNGGHTSQLAIALAAFNPVWNEEETTDKAFEQALTVASSILKRELASFKAREESAELAIDAANQDGQVAVLDRYAPIIMELCDSDKAFLVFPSQRGGWNAQVVPVNPSSRTPKVPFPHEWWGAAEENLPEGVTFCHASGFLLCAKDKNTAIKMCRIALQ